ncbi:hypothetical protein TraAM80_10514 [Trypanosoma rangeli]|uniref:Uncharacterized protein n=1 Tax=Trypanosoma rangeli TaxID=5698 RepID=A0A422MNV0_TRYRA|nr:uncharacterized protein TraAM80_10514 [Trypanosoma rangeli]RNE94895.1 hypothetical protein TraAM80_10514 [Trypanosoma rangeli]|eukprot:RNE94895.1 hypothetical protein TraAM80_10514 [Trypanosoma rangeli]
MRTPRLGVGGLFKGIVLQDGGVAGGDADDRAATNDAHPKAPYEGISVPQLRICHDEVEMLLSNPLRMPCTSLSATAITVRWWRWGSRARMPSFFLTMWASSAVMEPAPHTHPNSHGGTGREENCTSNQKHPETHTQQQRRQKLLEALLE